MSDKFKLAEQTEETFKVLRGIINDDDAMADMVIEIDANCHIVAVNHKEEYYYSIVGENVLNLMSFLNVWNDEDLAELWIGSVDFREYPFEDGIFTRDYKLIATIKINTEENGVRSYRIQQE